MSLVQCEECAAQISDKADRCPQCGAPPPQAKKHDIPTGEGFGLIFFIVLLGFGWMWFSGVFNGPPQTSPASRDKQVALALKAGDTVTLTNETLSPAVADDAVWVYVSQAANDASLRAAPANDEAGLRELLQNGQVFTVQPGTRALILQEDPLSLRAEVRILDGPEVGRKGWVPVPQIKR